MGKSRVSITIPHWNGKQMIKQTLEAIKGNTLYKNYEVIVVDNHSTDGSVELLRKMKKQGFVNVLVLNSENKGYSFAHNQAFALSKADFCFMLDSDTVPQKGWLRDAVEIAGSDESIATVGIQTVTPSQLKEGNYKLSNEIREKQTVCGAAMMVRKKVLNLIGALDAENFSPAYGEETDWNFRARSAGFRVVESHRSVVVHIGSQSSKRRGGNKWQYVLMNTNRLKAMLYNLSAIDFIRFVPGLSLIFLQSLASFQLHWLLRSYWNNLLGMPSILRQREKRKKAALRAKEKLAGV